VRKLAIATICGLTLSACVEPSSQHGPAPLVIGTAAASPATTPARIGMPHAPPQGIVLGALIENAEGAALSRADQKRIWNRTQYALEYGSSGVPLHWRNPETGHYGQVIPARAYQDNGNYCREYQQTIVIGDQTQQAFGRACRQADGSWKIQG